MCHNFTDQENQRRSYFGIDFRTKRKKSRVFFFWKLQNISQNCICFELAWSEFESYCLNNPEIAFLNFKASQGENMQEKKYETRQLRLEVIQTWGKRAMKHYYAKKRKRDSQDFAKRKRQVLLQIFYGSRCGYLSAWWLLPGLENWQSTFWRSWQHQNWKMKKVNAWCLGANISPAGFALRVVRTAAAMSGSARHVIAFGIGIDWKQKHERF